ncbi:asparagine synthase (glutamine-hydrolyzing) [Methanomicrobium sp. W14]|uniref:asparagine synthase (glutamine-hydrolyzing) n=1 Tax=Methanomicrobium sp. W14 TaxID=2817839 RepID=UPI001AE26E9C|nr:asparagine synthase (glutamine-hydrolyzing) [Methanomicrobium sp. W14]MBP2133366.1 asparagine synthase (glutamine-hydrolyzing) [Methanomicrobium sp. W14]
MCGIAGHYAFLGHDVDKDLLEKMSETLVHRGPDDSGIYCDDKTGLVHRRLSIIDLTAEGKQPMTNEDGSVWLVFNGEIYNYPELRMELLEKGHVFQTKTDSEVIIHSYEEWGEECLLKFNGMWAFAVWDKNTQTLFCARDRLGIKPFYYSISEKGIIFASEIKALCRDAGTGRRVNEEKLTAFLKWGISDYDDETMFEGVYQLLPGHYMTVHKDSADITKYWDTNPSKEVVSKKGADKGLSEKFLNLLSDSVKIHLRSDVDVGTCLSGGLDSSTITMIINGLKKENQSGGTEGAQNTFSAVFSDKRFDESEYIKVVADSSDVTPHYVSPDPKELWEDIDHLIYSNDEPFLQLTLYSQYCVMRDIGRNVKVVLDGQGADEMLGGYIAYFFCYIKDLFKKGHPVKAALETFGVLRNHRSFLSYAVPQFFVRKKRRNLIKGGDIPLKRYQGSLNEALDTDLKSTNLPYLLHWEDRTSMAFSVEARVPFLDFRVVEFLSSLPADQKIRKGVTKYILRKAIKGVVPEKIRCRMDKKGFSTPEEVWMKEDLKGNISGIINSESFKKRNYWNFNEVREEYDRFLDGKSGYSSEIWRIVCTELWLRIFFDKRSDGCALPYPHVFPKVQKT